MADYVASIAPFINNIFYVTSVFGVQETRTHRGIDIATPTADGNVPLYSMCNGIILVNKWNDSYGNYIIIKDNTSGLGFLYAHMQYASPLAVGETVEIGQFVGYEGTTGNSTGIHLHLEMQDLSENEWEFNADLNKYINPADFMSFPNTQGISVIYDGTPVNPPLFNRRKKSFFKWVLYANKIRKRNK